MTKYSAKAYAKINWTLAVLGERPDGYHDLKSIVLPIALHDDVEVSESSGGIIVEGCPGVPPEKNLVFTAAQKLADFVGLANPRVTIRLVKRIPAGGGLGGGSSDAAATLRLLNELWRLALSDEQLVQIAAHVGSDVPALVLGDPVLMEGRGERVRRLTQAECVGLPTPDEIQVYTPPIFASTSAVYREFRAHDRGLGRNDLQPAALRLYPAIGDALHLMESRGLSDVAMSGSGSTVYGRSGGPNPNG